MPHFKIINFYQNRSKVKLFLQKIEKLRALGAPLQDLPLLNSRHAPESNHVYVFALLVFMPLKFFLMSHFKSINFYQNKPKIKLFLQQTKFFECWELRLQALTGLRRIGGGAPKLPNTPLFLNAGFLVTRLILNVCCSCIYKI